MSKAVKNKGECASGVGQRRVEFRLFSFRRNVTGRGVIRTIKNFTKRNPWNPAMNIQLRRYQRENPGKNRKFTVVAIGEIDQIKVNHGIPCIHATDPKTMRKPGEVSNGWTPHYKFLAWRYV